MKPHIQDTLLYNEKDQAYRIKQAFLKIHNAKRKQRSLPASVYALALLFLSALFFL